MKQIKIWKSEHRNGVYSIQYRDAHTSRWVGHASSKKEAMSMGNKLKKQYGAKEIKWGEF